MNYFWIKTAQWGHIPFLGLWVALMNPGTLGRGAWWMTCVVLLVSFVLLIIVKLIVHAPRPFLAKHLKSPFWVPKYDSFPSGHAWLVATATVLLIVFRGPIALSLVLSGLGVLIAYARFRSGVHRAREVWVGYVGGVSVGIAAILLLAKGFI